MTNNTFYAVGDMKLRAFASSPDDIQSAYKESGYQIEFWETFSFQLDSPICDGDTVYTVVAKKL